MSDQNTTLLEAILTALRADGTTDPATGTKQNTGNTSLGSILTAVTTGALKLAVDAVTTAVQVLQQGSHIVAITPSDSAQANPLKAVYCLTAGTMYIKGNAADTAQPIVMVPGQKFDAMIVTHVLSTGPTSGTYAGIY